MAVNQKHYCLGYLQYCSAWHWFDCEAFGQESAILMWTLALAHIPKKALHCFTTRIFQPNLSKNSIRALDFFPRSKNFSLLRVVSFALVSWQEYDFFVYGCLNWSLSSSFRDPASELSLAFSYNETLAFMVSPWEVEILQQRHQM